MTSEQARSVRSSFEQVQAILHRDWDPIGAGVPRDEYDSYAWPVLKLLMAKAPRADVEHYLRDAAAGMMCAVPDARLKLTVDQLMTVKTG